MIPVKTLKDFVVEAKAHIEEIEISEVDAYITEGYQVLDVREPAEYKAGSIAGAFNMPRGMLEGAADHVVKGSDTLQSRDKKWLLLCKSSARSAMATVVLQQMGFTDVKNINGGFMAWEKAKKNVVIPD